ncbi:MAG: hypothetical protein NVSMB38_32880 [Ktedonobacteraceae bacterium]
MFPNRPTSAVHILKAGDRVRQGRYRLLEQMPPSENRAEESVVWQAIDLASPERHRIEIHEIQRTTEMVPRQQQVLHFLASRLTQIGQHSGLPTLLDTFDEDGKQYLVFQHSEGLSLAALLHNQGGALPERVVAEYGRQLCDILSFFSRQQPPFVHGSISPENIIVSSDEQRITLINLPLSPYNAPILKNKEHSGYHAPEQTRSNGSSSPASDLFSVAATMHHAVTGYNPSERIAFFYPPARRLNPKVSQRMEEILAQELRLSVSQRYARAVDMQADLSALMLTYPPLGLDPPPESVSPLARRQQFTTTQIRELSRNRSLVSYGIIGIVSLVVLLAALMPLLLPLLSPTPTRTQARSMQQQQQAALKTEFALEQQAFNAKGIGLSDGRFAFDTYTGRTDVVLKQEAGQAIQQGNLSSVVDLLTKTVLTDPADGEAQIYNADIHILQSGAPYVTIVLGVAIDKDPIDLIAARPVLQGAFIAQNEINRNGLLPHGLKLRLLIDSCGANHEDVATVAQFVANRVTKVGNLDNLIGVVGWPFSSQTINARDIIASVHLPLVSATASSVQLSGSSPYFFRVNPADDQQGKTLGSVAVTQLHAKKILVLRDPTEAYSVSLANAFTQSAQALGATTISNTFTSTKTAVADYEKMVNDALANRVDLIFIAGFDIDAIRLAHAVGEAWRANLVDPLLEQLHVLGGDALATNILLGQGSGPDAQIALDYQQDMRRLIFSGFGHPDEWTLENIPKNQQPTFFADWIATYQSSTDNTLNAPPPDNTSMLNTDAVHVLIQAVTLVQGAPTGQKVRDALASLGNGSVPAYQGVSGRILFDTQGNPIDKALVVLSIAIGSKGVNVIKLTQVVGKLQ